MSITVRKCEKLEEFHRCVDLQREIWGKTNPKHTQHITFVVANQTGGQVLGAFDGSTMVGFTLALPGVRNGRPYLHSHMTGVLASHRDHRVGRLLKLFQRDEAITRGIHLVEWTFDPLETRNAHFNLNRLGAICRYYIPNFYGVTSSPLHRGLPTDRLLAEWHLDSPRVVAATKELTRDPVDCPTAIHLPKEFDRWQADQDVDKLAAAQTHLREEFLTWFGKGYAATGIRFTLTGVDYCLAPWSEF